jgi:hypothetical protein
MQFFLGDVVNMVVQNGGGSSARRTDTSSSRLEMIGCFPAYAGHSACLT